MKKILLVLLFTASMAAGQSLIKEGTKIINGTVSISSTSGYTAFNISPEFGYFVNDNLVLGASMGILLTDGSSGDTWQLGPYVRYYKNYNDLAFFLTTGYSYSSRFKGGNVGLGVFNIGTGMDHFLTENVAFETILDFSVVNGQREHYRMLRLGIGINYFFE